jgi:hypothetical protein
MSPPHRAARQRAKFNHMEAENFYRLAYGKLMGGHFFDRLVEVCQGRYPDLEAETFRQPCRDEFARRFPDYDTYFPPTVRYFSEDRDQFGQLPKHRSASALTTMSGGGMFLQHGK